MGQWAGSFEELLLDAPREDLAGMPLHFPDVSRTAPLAFLCVSAVRLALIATAVGTGTAAEGWPLGPVEEEYVRCVHG